MNKELVFRTYKIGNQIILFFPSPVHRFTDFSGLIFQTFTLLVRQYVDFLQFFFFLMIMASRPAFAHLNKFFPRLSGIHYGTPTYLDSCLRPSKGGKAPYEEKKRSGPLVKGGGILSYPIITIGGNSFILNKKATNQYCLNSKSRRYSLYEFCLFHSSRANSILVLK